MKPSAIAAYVLAVPTPGSEGNGVLVAYPSDQPTPASGTGSTVNVTESNAVGNSTNITLCTPDSCVGDFNILSRRNDRHVVVDVLGYYYEPFIGVASFSAGNSINLPATQPTEVASLDLTVPSAGIVTLHFRSTVISQGGGVSLGCLVDLNREFVAIAGEMFADGTQDGLFIFPLSGCLPIPVEAGNVSLSVEFTSNFDVSTRIGAVTMVTSFAPTTVGAQ